MTACISETTILIAMAMTGLFVAGAFVLGALLYILGLARVKALGVAPAPADPEQPFPGEWHVPTADEDPMSRYEVDGSEMTGFDDPGLSALANMTMGGERRKDPVAEAFQDMDQRTMEELEKGGVR